MCLGGIFVDQNWAVLVMRVSSTEATLKHIAKWLSSAVQIVAFATDTKTVLGVCVSSDMLRSVLPTLLEQLEMCQKSLTAYLETKRAEFPRFYFVSDPTLLEILSLGSDPPSVVPHFQSGLFDSLSGVTFDKAIAPQNPLTFIGVQALFPVSFESIRPTSIQFRTIDKIYKIFHFSSILARPLSCTYAPT